jgi:hypothetical protein
MMFKIFEDFKTYPPSVQKGLVLLAAGWLWFYVTVGFVAGIQIPPRMYIVGLSVLLLAGSMKNWARLLCIMCNGMAILYFVVLAIDIYRSQAKGSTLVLSLLFGAVLFALPIFFLSIHPASEFYKKYNYGEIKPDK